MLSEFDEEELEHMRQRQLREDLAREPSKGGLKRALGKLKSDKVEGSSGILPEMVTCEEEEFPEFLLALVHTGVG